MTTSVVAESEHFTIYEVDPDYLVFEHNELGDELGGGIWLEHNRDVIDYDGVYMLPYDVFKLLEENGYTFDGVSITEADYTN